MELLRLCTVPWPRSGSVLQIFVTDFGLLYSYHLAGGHLSSAPEVEVAEDLNILLNEDLVFPFQVVVVFEIPGSCGPQSWIYLFQTRFRLFQT